MLNYQAIIGVLLVTLNNLEYGMSTLTGQCNECFASGIACLAEQTFVRCSDSTPTSIRTPCPAGTVCTADNNICVDTSQGAVPVCYEDTESTTGSETEPTTLTTTELSPFTTSEASTETTTKTMTSEPTIPITTVITTETIVDTTTESPATTISAITPEITTLTTSKGTGEITTKSKTEATTSTSMTIDTTTSTTVTSSSSTIATTPDTTTTVAPKDPNSHCANISKKGNFRVDGDTTCSRYIYCYLLGGQYLGWAYTCSQYFNAETGKCQQARPADC